MRYYIVQDLTKGQDQSTFEYFSFDDKVTDKSKEGMVLYRRTPTGLQVLQITRTTKQWIQANPNALDGLATYKPDEAEKKYWTDEFNKYSSVKNSPQQPPQPSGNLPTPPAPQPQQPQPQPQTQPAPAPSGTLPNNQPQQQPQQPPKKGPLTEKKDHTEDSFTAAVGALTYEGATVMVNSQMTLLGDKWKGFASGVVSNLLKSADIVTGPKLAHYILSKFNTNDLKDVFNFKDIKVEHWELVISEDLAKLFAPTQADLEKVLLSIKDPAKFHHFLNLPGALTSVTKLTELTNVIDSAQPKQSIDAAPPKQGFVIAAASAAVLGVLKLINIPAIIGLISDLPSLKVALAVVGPEFAKLLSVVHISSLITTAEEVGSLLVHVLPTHWGAFLSHANIVSKLAGGGAEVFGKLLSGVVKTAEFAAGKVNLSDLLNLSEVWSLCKDIPGLASGLTAVGAEGAKLLLSIPQIAKLLPDAGSVFQLLAKITKELWEVVASHENIIPMIKGLHLTTLISGLTHIVKEDRPAALSLSSVSGSVKSILGVSEAALAIGGLLDLLPHEHWSKLITDTEYKIKNSTELATLLASIPVPHWKESYIAEVLGLPSFTEYMQKHDLEIILNHLQPVQRVSFVANNKHALQYFQDLIAMGQDEPIWKMLNIKDQVARNDLTQHEKDSLKTLLTATLAGYKEYSDRTQKYSWKVFNKLGNRKREIVAEVLTSGKANATTFENMFNSVDSKHKIEAHKANKLWLFSNRWRVRSGKHYGADKKADWDENRDSRLGQYITKFRKP